LPVRLHGHGVVALQDGVLEFREADGDALLVAFGEVVALQHPGNVDLAVQAEKVGAGQLAQPFSVAADFGPFLIDDAENLVGVGFGVLFDDLGFEGRPGLGSAGGITDAGGVVAHDDDGKMAGVLELADLGENEGAWPRWRSGAEGSKPSLTRRGRPEASFLVNSSLVWMWVQPLSSWSIDIDSA